MNKPKRHLIVVPQLAIFTLPDGRFQLTKKFVDGMTEYAKLWTGSITVVAIMATEEDSNLDHVAVISKDLPFEMRIAKVDLISETMNAVRNGSVVLGSLDFRQVELAKLCLDAGLPLIYVTEYSLLTRIQIIQADCPNIFRRYRRRIWESQTERKFQKSVRLATGLQCNGTPTFEAYKHLNNNRFLFFDTRVTSEMIAKDADINLKTEGLLRDQPLRLAFSGRLLSIKGVDHLPLVAAELKRRQILFTMDIFGGGEYEPKLRRDIAKYDLTKEVTLHGVVDFKTQLMPRINKNTDLFVCCHRQGDPSCTYLETLACGTPIVGYGNEAFLGLLQYGDFGWSSPINDPIALADQIGKINRDRQNLAKAMKTARNFAMQHSFEVTFSRRIEHIQQCS